MDGRQAAKFGSGRIGSGWGSRSKKIALVRNKHLYPNLGFGSGSDKNLERSGPVGPHSSARCRPPAGPIFRPPCSCTRDRCQRDETPSCGLT